MTAMTRKVGLSFSGGQVVSSVMKGVSSRDLVVIREEKVVLPW